MRRSPATVLSLALFALPAAAQAAASDPWKLNFALTGYYVPDGTSYLQPTLMADHNGLHLEARYQYEELNSGSAWIGINLAGGKTVQVAFTAMGGVVFGDLEGIAPGAEITVTFWRLAYYGEAEYVYDVGSGSGDFFYAWTQFTFQLDRAWSAGLAFQRTRTVQTGLALDRGVTLNWQPHELGIQATAFDLFDSHPFYTLAATLYF
jgi:hypothetical protein